MNLHRCFLVNRINMIHVHTNFCYPIGTSLLAQHTIGAMSGILKKETEYSERLTVLAYTAVDHEVHRDPGFQLRGSRPSSQIKKGVRIAL